jgi:hypothetical protein
VPIKSVGSGYIESDFCTLVACRIVASIAYVCNSMAWYESIESLSDHEPNQMTKYGYCNRNCLSVVS